jgi:insertion element IS1 protein InsB
MRCGISFKKSRKLWVWRAYDPFRRRTVAWVLGGRDDASCLRLLAKIGLQGKTFIADHWDGFRRLIPSHQLLTGKQYTHDIERDNSNIRHFLARFRRRTKVVSKQAYRVDLSLRLYHYLHDDLDNMKAYLQQFICIFG